MRVEVRVDLAVHHYSSSIWDVFEARNVQILHPQPACGDKGFDAGRLGGVGEFDEGRGGDGSAVQQGLNGVGIDASGF